MSKYVVLKLYLLNVVLTLHTTKKYWRSAGIRRTGSSRIQKRSRCFFTSANLQKIAELKSMSGLFFLLFNQH